MARKKKKKKQLSVDLVIDRLMGIKGFSRDLRRAVFQVPAQPKAGRKPR